VLDRDVLIEILRGDDRAKTWLASIESSVIGIPVFVWMEILLGARDQQEQQALAADLARYTILHLESGDSPKAQQWFAQFHLSHGIDILDCLIATIPARLSKPCIRSTSSTSKSSQGLMPRRPINDRAPPLHEHDF
jgi:predicted nucleic acid-binding protein